MHKVVLTTSNVPNVRYIQQFYYYSFLIFFCLPSHTHVVNYTRTLFAFFDRELCWSYPRIPGYCCNVSIETSFKTSHKIQTITRNQQLTIETFQKLKLVKTEKGTLIKNRKSKIRGGHGFSKLFESKSWKLYFLFPVHLGWDGDY